MTKQDNTENKLLAPNHIVRVVRIELVANRSNVLNFVPSSYLLQVIVLLEHADEIEMRLKIDDETGMMTSKS